MLSPATGEEREAAAGGGGRGAGHVAQGDWCSGCVRRPIDVSGRAEKRGARVRMVWIRNFRGSGLFIGRGS